MVDVNKTISSENTTNAKKRSSFVFQMLMHLFKNVYFKIPGGIF